LQAALVGQPHMQAALCTWPPGPKPAYPLKLQHYVQERGTLQDSKFYLVHSLLFILIMVIRQIIWYYYDSHMHDENNFEQSE